jgi:hypothetical protein
VPAKRHRDVLLIQYDRYMNFLNLITQLCRISSNEKGLSALKKDLKKYPNAIGVDWVRKKIREL